MLANLNALVKQIADLDWESIRWEMERQGYAVIPDFIPHSACNQLIADYDKEHLYRKIINLERHRFGFGQYKYFNYPLPPVIQTIRETMYPKLAVIANSWMELLRIEKSFPATFEKMQTLCHKNDQRKSTVLILKYGPGGYNTLHQDLYGEVYFPLQSAIFLNQPHQDYQGGEFVLLEQVPRAQSKAIVLKPNKGDLVIFATSFHPAKGKKGHYRVNMKHGVGEITSGERHTLGIIFHDA